MTDQDHVTWDDTVAALEEAVVRQRVALAEGRFDGVGACHVPATLGPVPARLRARANRVLAETLALEQAVETRMDTLARRTLAARQASSRATRRAALFIDRSA